MVTEPQIIEFLKQRGVAEGRVAIVVALLLSAVELSYLAGLTDKEFRTAAETLHWIYQSLPERPIPSRTVMAPMSKVTH